MTDFALRMMLLSLKKEMCNFLATKWLQKIRNYREKSHFLKETTLKAPENTPSYTTDYPTLIHEGGRTVGSGRLPRIFLEAFLHERPIGDNFLKDAL